MRRREDKHGFAIFEALLAITLLVISVLAFFSLFNSGTKRAWAARSQRNAVRVADNVLSTLRCLSEENARTNGWLAFWTGFLNTDTNIDTFAIFNPAADAWSNLLQSSQSPPILADLVYWPSNVTDNIRTREECLVRFRLASITTNDWLIGCVETNRSGWYQYHADTNADTAQTVVRYQISARYGTNSVGDTDTVYVVVSAWPGAESPMTRENEVRLFAEFKDSGAL